MATRYTIKKSFDPSQFTVDYSKELNTEQFEVIEKGEGPVLVIAGAGSGKTRTLVYRVAYLIERGVRPENILLVTFTNKAAKEMLFRVERLLGTFPKSLWGGTFHHVANLLLRKHAKRLGFHNNFTILDQEDSRSLVKVLVKDLGIDPKARRFPSPAVIQGILSLAANTESSVKETVLEYRSAFEDIIPDLERIGVAYKERKLQNNQMDFDDMLVYLLKLLKEHDDVRKKLAAQFQYVLVDEYQDTNTIQADIVQLLASHHKNLLVVGDDAQSIYSFRGADIANILDFPKQFPDAQTFYLTKNYRSTQPVLDLANDVIARNTKQFEKELVHVRSGGEKPQVIPAQSASQEAEFIAQRILELRDEGVPLREMAVLFRASHHSQQLEFELTKRDVPYEYRGGMRFFERAHIKDTIGHLRLLENNHDEVTWMRVLTLQMGIGSVSAGKLTAIARRQEQLADALRQDFSSVLTSRSATGFKRFQALAIKLTQQRESGPAVLIRLVKDSDYAEYLRNQFPDWESRMEDIEQLAVFAEQYASLGTFLSEVSLQESFGMAQTGEADGDNEDAMVLSTVHQAKGLEWEVVFVLNLSEGAFPNAKALDDAGGLEEERRLFYVAITRAKTYCFLTYHLGLNMRTTSMHLQSPSQFLEDIDSHLIERVELEEEYQERVGSTIFKNQLEWDDADQGENKDDTEEIGY
ncbi:MAG: UvrD-helicase domain-containing protein [Patescibacteria group bacterium]|jgi:DNA helicase-2/ATP-dependent DNA helicase PcrA